MFKRTLFSLIIYTTFWLSNVYAQQAICLGDDATICLGDQITINDCGNLGAGNTGAPYTMAQIPYNPDPFATPNTVNLTDDSFSGVVNIGFDFCFYGNTYNQLVISSNNLVSFDIANANGYSSWVTSAVPDPTANTTFNSIMCPWQDINPGVGGTITYATYGTAPNRRFVVTWDNVPMFSCTGQLYSSQIKIFETTNYIETHIVNKTVCATWNSGNAVHGVHSPGGTDALTVPGRNNTQWNVANEGYEFIPQANIQWFDTEGNAYPYNAGSLTVTPNPTLPSDSIGYFLRSADNCGNGVNISDTSWITVSNPAVTASGTDDLCTSGSGEVTATAGGGVAPYTYSWPALGSANQTTTGVLAGTYQVQVTDAIGCTATDNVTIGDTPAAFQGSITVVSCPGGNDGTAFAEMVPVLGNITYQWDDPAMQTTQTATGLTAGQYTCTITSDIGCVGTVVLDVTEIPGMIGNISNQSDVTCNSGSDGVIEVTVTQGTAPYTYIWDNSTSTTNIANDLAVGPHTVTVTDANGCVITVSGVLAEPAALDITSITPDTQICPEDDILLSATGSGGSSAYTFTWFENGTQIGTGADITVDPDVTNTQYCVELSEACGSPTDQECVLIYFPTPIVPSAEPAEKELCVPNTFEFFNTSSNAGEIATTFWEFGDHVLNVELEQGADSVSHYYEAIGFHDITMTVTSIYGCVYTDTLFDLIEVLPSPTADFNFSANPATIFETTVFMQDKSSSDVVDWQWFSPGSQPMQSTSTNPIFEFPEGVVMDYPVTLVVTTERGCVDTTTLYFNVIEDILFFAPNAFTPDGDEHNQSWKPMIEGIDIYDYEIIIFNRWGQVIWESRDPNVAWDGTHNGKLVQAGVYQWKATVKSPYTDDRSVFSGSVSILK